MKQVLSIVLALVAGFILVQLLLWILSIALATLSFLFKAAMIAIFAVPVYLILRKTLLKK